MPNRKPRRKDFAGKTIDHVNTYACNVWTFYFTDGTSTTIEAEVFHGAGLATMEICQECIQPRCRTRRTNSRPLANVYTKP